MALKPYTLGFIGELQQRQEAEGQDAKCDSSRGQQVQQCLLPQEALEYSSVIARVREGWISGGVTILYTGRLWHKARNLLTFSVAVGVAGFSVCSPILIGNVWGSGFGANKEVDAIGC